MPHTYTQIYIHLVFAVRKRAHHIPRDHREELHKYITGIVRAKGHIMMAINSMPDHIHMFICLSPEFSLSELVRDIKTGSAHLINTRSWAKAAFRWQEGYGAFSHSRAQVPVVIQYIREQERHHARKSFRSEFVDTLKRFEIEFDERYLPGWEEDLQTKV